MGKQTKKASEPKRYEIVTVGDGRGAQFIVALTDPPIGISEIVEAAKELERLGFRHLFLEPPTADDTHQILTIAPLTSKMDVRTITPAPRREAVSSAPSNPWANAT